MVPDIRSTTRTRLAGIEGLRAVAAFSVLAWHVWAHPIAGTGYGVDFGPLSRVFDTLRVGVAMFFVLSGFLLFRPFAAAIVRKTALPSLRAYSVNRMLRIIPLYWSVLLLLAITSQHALLRRPWQLLADMAFLQDYIPSYQPTWDTGVGIMPAWSLCVEVVYYATLPLLAFGAVRLGRRLGVSGLPVAVAPVVVLGLVGIASMCVYRVWLTDGVFEDSFLTHTHWFAVGMTAAIVRVYWEEGRLEMPRWSGLAAGATIVALAACAVEAAASGRITFLEEHSMLAVACGLLVGIVALARPDHWAVRALEWRPLVLAGLLSYGVFLWHEPCLRFFRGEGLTWQGRVGFLADLALVAATATILAALTYVVVERPALAHKRGRLEPSPGGRRSRALSAMLHRHAH